MWLGGGVVDLRCQGDIILVILVGLKRKGGEKMKTKLRWLATALVVAALVFAVSAATAAAMLIPASEVARDKAKADNSPVIDKADDHLVLTPPGLERIVFIHYKKGFAKPPSAGKGKECPGYKYLGKWVRWKSLPVDYVIDPDNPDGLTEGFVTSAISKGAEEWDAHTGVELFADTYSIDHNASWDSAVPDGRNELLFGNYPEYGVIAVTVVWGYFSGPPEMREIIEFDVLFDTDFTWGDADPNNDGVIDNPNVMDLQNIATHEIGHGAGLADLYDLCCAEETMYGYSEYGEVKKRDLNTGDISGIQGLYGI